MKMTNFRWKVAWLIFAISFVSYMDRVNLSVATPVIMKEFGFTKIDMGLIQSFFFAGYALMQVPGGMLAEKFGHRFTGSIACGWSPVGLYFECSLNSITHASSKKILNTAFVKL